MTTRPGSRVGDVQPGRVRARRSRAACGEVELPDQDARRCQASRRRCRSRRPPGRRGPSAAVDLRVVGAAAAAGRRPGRRSRTSVARTTSSIGPRTSYAVCRTDRSSESPTTRLATIRVVPSSEPSTTRTASTGRRVDLAQGQPAQHRAAHREEERRRPRRRRAGRGAGGELGIHGAPSQRTRERWAPGHAPAAAVGTVCVPPLVAAAAARRASARGGRRPRRSAGRG